MKGIVRVGLLLTLVTVAVYVINLVWFRPLSVHQFFNRSFILFVLDKPEMLSQLRILEQFGLSFHQDELDDESEAAHDREIATLKKNIRTLESYDRRVLAAQEALSYDIFSWFTRTNLRTAEEFRYYNYPVNQLFGVQNNFPSFMESAHQIHDSSDARDYIARMEKVGTKFSAVKEGLIRREQAGIIPPRFVVQRVLDEMRNFVSQAPESNILYTSFDQKMQKAGFDDETRQTYLVQASATILEDVYPAYQTFIGYFDQLLPKTDDRAGVWKFPRGDEFYQHMLLVHTTLPQDPEQLHTLGLNEVGRIQGEMRSILTGEGYDPTIPVGILMQRLAEEPRFLYPDTDEGRAAILRDYQAIIDEAARSLNTYFAIEAKAPVVVERIPLFKEKTAPGAYYNSPALDGSRPGIFYANLHDIKATPKFDMRTLAYHEAIPGHHFQIALAQETKELPFFRRLIPFTVFAEGWALYAERVAWEAGLQKDPYDNLGRLQAELFRAVRLVVDTGLHAKRWSREEAITYMKNNTGMAESDVISEIERYIVMPGQACAYKVGMMKIQELRARAEGALGDRFDIRTFHSLILKNGAMPLSVLDGVVQSWIDGQLPKAPTAQQETPSGDKA